MIIEKKVFILRDNGIRDRCKTFIDTVEIGDDKTLKKVTIEDYKKNRSAAQQALMYIWHGQWCDYTGDSETAEHIRFKADYLLPILLRDNVIPGLDDIVADAELQQISGNPYRLQAVYKLITTNALNVAQFSEILTQYNQDAAMAGCIFTVRGPQYDEAMGR